MPNLVEALSSSKDCDNVTLLINSERANLISVGLFLMRQVWRTCRERNYKTPGCMHFGKDLVLLMAIRVLFQWEVDSGHGVSSRKGYDLSSWLWLGNYDGKRFTCLKKNEEFGVSMSSGKSKIRTWLFEGAVGREFHKRNWIVMSVMPKQAVHQKHGNPLLIGMTNSWWPQKDFGFKEVSLQFPLTCLSCHFWEPCSKQIAEDSRRRTQSGRKTIVLFYRRSAGLLLKNYHQTRSCSGTIQYRRWDGGPTIFLGRDGAWCLSHKKLFGRS